MVAGFPMRPQLLLFLLGSVPCWPCSSHWPGTQHRCARGFLHPPFSWDPTCQPDSQTLPRLCSGSARANCQVGAIRGHLSLPQVPHVVLGASWGGPQSQEVGYRVARRPDTEPTPGWLCVAGLRLGLPDLPAQPWWSPSVCADWGPWCWPQDRLPIVLSGLDKTSPGAMARRAWPCLTSTCTPSALLLAVLLTAQQHSGTGHMVGELCRGVGRWLLQRTQMCSEVGIFVGSTVISTHLGLGMLEPQHWTFP